MAKGLGDDEYSLKVAGGGITIDKTVSEQVALQILKLVMGDSSAAPGTGTGGVGSGAPAGAFGAAVTPTDTSTPKAFMAAKRPKTDVERVTCLAYYLTHHRATPAFKTKALSDLNVEAAGTKFSNMSVAVANATRSNTGFLSGAGGGNKQITARGEALVTTLPDRDKVNLALDEHPAKKPRKQRARRKSK